MCPSRLRLRPSKIQANQHGDEPGRGGVRVRKRLLLAQAIGPAATHGDTARHSDHNKAPRGDRSRHNATPSRVVDICVGEALSPVGLPLLVHVSHAPVHWDRGRKEYRRSEGDQRLDVDPRPKRWVNARRLPAALRPAPTFELRYEAVTGDGSKQRMSVFGARRHRS